MKIAQLIIVLKAQSFEQSFVR